MGSVRKGKKQKWKKKIIDKKSNFKEGNGYYWNFQLFSNFNQIFLEFFTFCQEFEQQSQPASKSNMMKYPRFHDFHSNRQFSLIISIINSQHLYGKPPTLLRDLGSKNHKFWSESMFLKKETDYLIWSHRSWYIKHFSLKSAIFGEKKFKNFETSPSSKFAKNGRPEPLWSRGFSVQMLSAPVLR